MVRTSGKNQVGWRLRTFRGESCQFARNAFNRTGRLIRGTLSRLGFGRLLLRLWHQPLARIRDFAAAGGPWTIRATAKGRTEMQRASLTLPPLSDYPSQTPVAIHVLTGVNYWFQTAFCLHSFSNNARTSIDLHLYDDGSIGPELLDQIRRFAPRASVLTQSELMARLDQHLPVKSYPTLRERWQNYPNIRKLIDPHLGSHGWKLVIDSDLLFFRQPDFLLKWLNSPRQILHAVDCLESYGYSRTLLERLAGCSLPSRVNVGLCGLKSDAIDWEQMERWCRELTVINRPSYYLEQALVAMLAARQSCDIAPAEDYVTMPQPPEAVECRAVMHHYVAESKCWYFRENWRRVLNA